MRTLVVLLTTSLVSAGLAGCASKAKRNLPELKPVEKVDLDRYMGEWYVIASIPTGIESNAYNAVERYTWNELEKRVDIHFSYNKNSFDGTPKSIPQKGFIADPKTNARWEVQPVWPLKFTSMIVDVAPDYSYSVVGVPSREYVWIMSRQPKMNAKKYAGIVEKVRSMGYDVTKLRMIPQAPSAERTRTE